jgi:hypothetical protein
MVVVICRAGLGQHVTTPRPFPVTAARIAQKLELRGHRFEPLQLHIRPLLDSSLNHFLKWEINDGEEPGRPDRVFAGGDCEQRKSRLVALAF